MLHLQRGNLGALFVVVLLGLLFVHDVLAATCPAGSTLHIGWGSRCSNVNHHLYYLKPPDHNGCGLRGATVATTANAVRCCRAHDICYSLAGATEGYCNQEFKACLTDYSPAEYHFADDVAGMCISAYKAGQEDYLACRTFYEPLGSYVGCFEDFTTRVLPYRHSTPAWAMVDQSFHQGDFTVQMCRTECASRKYLYSGVEAGGECYCGNTVPTSVKPESECNMPCYNDQQQLCGGNWRISVYKTGYVGCFTDSTTRDLPFQAVTSTPMDGMTAGSGYIPLMCMAECQNLGYRYAGLQYGGYCFCGNSYGGQGVAAESTCTQACDAILETNQNGRVKTVCGGAWANQVYDTHITLGGFKRYSFWLKSSMNDLCMQWDATGYIIAVQCTKDARQQFVVDGERIHPLTDMGKCLDSSGGVSAGASMLVYNCNGQDNQRFVRSGDRFKPSVNGGLCWQIGSNYGSTATLQACSSSPGGQGWRNLGETISFGIKVSNNEVFDEADWIDVNSATNYAVGRGAGGWGCSLKTSYSKIFIDRKTMMIDTSRREYSSTVVLSGDPATCGSSSVAYGTASLCTGSESSSMIDLSGTPFVPTSTFALAGWNPHGSVTYSNNGKTIAINGGGYCGWMATNEANGYGEDVAIVWGGKHIKVEMPRQAISDTGFSTMQPRGWFDLQQQGQYKDYCRYVGDGSNIRLSCALGGSTNQYGLDYVPLTPLTHYVIPQSDCAVLYQDCGFSGNTFTMGISYRAYFVPDFSDRTSSMRVAPGCTLTLWIDVAYGGASYTYKNDVACLGNVNNDAYSSASCTCP